MNSASYRPPLLRRLGIGFFRTLVRLAIKHPLTDCTSGFRAYQASALDFLTSDVFPYDYPDGDLLISLHQVGFRIREVPVHMTASTSGKSMHGGLKPLYYVFKMLLSISVTLMDRPPASR